MSNSQKNNTLPIIMMFLLFAMIAFVTNLCNPMGVIVKNQFGASNFEAQLGNAANFIAYAIMGIPSGLLLKKIGYKNTALLAIILGFIGVFLEYMSGWDSIKSFPVYIIGAFVAGFCMCMLNTVVNPMLNTLGGGGNKGNQLIQFGGVLNSFSATAVTMLGGALIGEATKAKISDATPALFIALAIFAVVFFVLLFVRIPEPSLAQQASDAGQAQCIFVPPLPPWHPSHLPLFRCRSWFANIHLTVFIHSSRQGNARLRNGYRHCRNYRRRLLVIDALRPLCWRYDWRKGLKSHATYGCFYALHHLSVSRDVCPGRCYGHCFRL